jgi:hypothetical protein
MVVGRDDIEVLFDDDHRARSSVKNATPSIDGHVAEGAFQGLGAEARTICKRRK